MKTIVINEEFRKAAEGDSRMQEHVDFIKTARQFAARNERHLLGLSQSDKLLINAGIPVKDFFRDTDRTIDGVRLNDKYMFMQDLAPLARTVNVGKLSAVSLKSSDISDDIAVSMDFNPNVQHDHISADSDRNPIPAFLAGVTMGYRHRSGLDSEGIDLYNDSVALKTRKLTEKVGLTMLDGDASIKADGFACEGIKNHRNTRKLDLGASGYNIDLTASATTNDAIIAFWNQSIKTVLNDEVVSKLDKVYVSPAMMTRLLAPLSDAGEFKMGTLLDQVLRFAPHIGAIEQDFALSGNEWFGYMRDASVIRPIVAMATGAFLLPRQMPIDAYKTRIVTAQGVEIKQTMNGKRGVFYASEIS